MIKKEGGVPYKIIGYNSIKSKLKPLNSTPAPKQKSRTAYSTANRTTTNNIHKMACMNDQLFIQRRQNHLNTCYNNRKNKLKQISKNNVHLYKRINSQKSLYSQKSINKSTDSLKSSSRCSSRSSLKSKNSTTRKLGVKDKKEINHITIQSENINKTNRANLNEFRSMFMRDQPKKLHNPLIKNSNDYNSKNRSFSLRSDKQQSLKGPQTNRTMTNIGGGMGNMLHRIAQQMLQPEVNKNAQKKKRRALI